MALYYYDRYRVIETLTGYSEPGWTVLDESRLTNPALSGNTGYSYDRVNNKFTVTSGNVTFASMSVGQHFYRQSGNDLLGYTLTAKDYDGYAYRYRYRSKSVARATPNYSYSRGNLIGRIEATDGAYPSNGRSGSYWYIKRGVVNATPTIELHTTNNQTLYENDTFKIEGSAVDIDNGDIVNVKYQINEGTVRALATSISDGSSPIAFNKQLTFKGGQLYDGATVVTPALTESTAHTLNVWSEDDQGGKSVVEERTFYVVPNRAPTLTIDPFEAQSGMINNDSIPISGTSFDADGNDVIVRYRLNGAAAVQIYDGTAGPWSFDLKLKDLKDGENNIVVEVTDTYNFKSSLTVKLNRHANLTPLSQSVQRYKITPPSGSAQGAVLWVRRHEEQVVDVEISMTNGTEQEQFVPMTLANTAPVDGVIEDQFTYQADSAKENIIVKINLANDSPVVLISGVLS